MRNLVLAGIFLLSLSQHAYALFGDDEARKQIQELQKKTDSQNQATQDTIKKNQQALEQRIAALENAIKGQGMLDLLNQIDRLNQELSNVKGQLEIANHNLELAQQRQKDLYADTDGRLRKLETGAPATSSTDVPVTNSSAVAAIENAGEVKDFEAAQAFSRAGKHKEAFEAFGKFLQTYPTSSRAPDAQYALGYAQFSLKNYNAAIATQQKLLKQFPDSPKAPDAAFNIANSQIQLADIDGAKKTLRDLLAKYPASEVAPKAKSRLTVLDSIKK